MSRILLITTYFYPQNRIPVLRVAQWAKYWALMGCKVTVLTTRKYGFMGPFGLNESLPSNVEIIEIDYLPKILINKLENRGVESVFDKKVASKTHQKESFVLELKRIFRGLRGYIGSLMDIHDFWVSSATKKGLELLSLKEYDLIVSSYSPPAVHVVAKKLKNKYPDVKWIADFRDPWARNHIQSARGIFALYENYKEKSIIQSADCLVTVSAPSTKELQSHYPDKIVHTIENGFDPEEFPTWKEDLQLERKIDCKIKIVYAGFIYPGKRDPSPLFIACNELIDDGIISKEDIAIDFYGNNKKELDAIIDRIDGNRNNIININGFVTRKKSLQAQKKSDLLLFLEWNDPTARSTLPGKLFEYLVSGVPILAVGVDTKNCSGQLIEETRTGKTALNSNEIKQILKDIYKTKYISFYKPVISKIEKYSRSKQAKAMLNLV